MSNKFIFAKSSLINLFLLFGFVVLYNSFTFHFCSADDLKLQIPRLSAPVVDQAQVISDINENKINTLLKSVNDSGGSQIQVLTINTLNGVSIEEASIEVATSWKLGNEKTDKGVLLLVAVDDRQVRIEVGQGLEGSLTDAYSNRIIEQIIVPNFKSGDYNQGILQGVLGILKYTDPDFKFDGLVSDYDRSVVRKNSDQGELPFGFRIIIFLIILLIIFFLDTGKSNRGGGGFGGYHGGGGGFGGGGGWSGGGGGFSGGGSSGRW